MPTELEAQLRALSRALDSYTPPVSAAEITGSSRMSDSRSLVRVGDPGEVEALPGTKRRWIFLATAAAVLVFGMIGAIAVLDRSPEPSTPAVSDDDRSATPPPIDTAPSEISTTSMPGEGAGPTLLEVTITPADAGRPRPDLFPIVRDLDVSDAFGQYSAEATPTQRVVGLVGRIEDDQLLDGIRIELEERPSSAESGGVPQVVEIDGASFGTITSIIDINGQPVALLDLLAEFPIAGDAATVVMP